MNTLYKVIAVSFLSIGMASAACTFDLRQRNLVNPIEKWVSEATAAGIYNDLPQLIKDTHVQIQANNFMVEGLPKLKELAQLVSSHALSTILKPTA